MLQTPDEKVVPHREVQYSQDAQGNLEVTGLVLGEGNRTWEAKADAYVAALDVPGAQRLIPPDWRRLPIFDNIYKLTGVPVVTVQLRCVPNCMLRCRVSAACRKCRCKLLQHPLAAKHQLGTIRACAQAASHGVV